MTVTDISFDLADTIAQSRIQGFLKCFDDEHFDLAMHSALPLNFSPDLIYRIWAELLPESPYIAVPRFLLSRLCNVVGYETYAMDKSVRKLLILELKNKFGQQRIKLIAELLLNYVNYKKDCLCDDYDENSAIVNQFIALFYISPYEAAKKIAEEISENLFQDADKASLLLSIVFQINYHLIDWNLQNLLIYAQSCKGIVERQPELAIAKLTELINKTPLHEVDLCIQDKCKLYLKKYDCLCR